MTCASYEDSDRNPPVFDPETHEAPLPESFRKGYRAWMDAAYWRDALKAELDEAAAGRLVVDCRSATYVAAWRPSTATRVQIAVVEERDGVRRVVSHMAKKSRGEVARHLLVSGARPRTPADLRDAVAEQFACELRPPDRASGPFVLTVVQA